MKVCNTFELKNPTNMQISNLLRKMIPENEFKERKEILIQYIQSDLRKLNFTEQLYKNKSHLLNEKILKNIFQIKSFNEDSKRLT